MPQCSSVPWYAVRTRSNAEKLVATSLKARGFEQYLPLSTVRKVWSDRVIESTVPLLGGYVFCRFDSTCRSRILGTPGVSSIVGFSGVPAVIADSEIDAIKIVLRSGLSPQHCGYVQEGQRIRVLRGPLKGLEGILLKKRDLRIVISVEMLQRSLAVEVDSDCVAAICQ